jgi:hypothetical protein
MTWATPPYATGTSSIAMVATTASDTNGVQYYFTCVTGPGHNSSWQDSPTYEDTGLADRTKYEYTVKARDLSVNYNQTAASDVGWATTPDGTPPVPDPMTWDTVPYATGPSSMVATTASDPNGVQYYFENITIIDGTHDSGWQNSPSYEDTGLDDLTEYTYTVMARDLSVNYNMTAPSDPCSATTEDGTPPTPDPMTWASVPRAEWATWTYMTATTAYDPSGVEYYFTELSDPNHDSGWQDSTFYQDNGTAPETQYIYTVKARDKSINQNETAPSSAESVTTPPPRPPVAIDVIASAFMDEPKTITLRTIDDGLPDPPAILDLIITSLPANGTLSDPGAGPIGAVGYVLVNNGDQVIYTPDSKYLGVDTFSFKADDGGVPPQGGESNEADVLISVVVPEYFTEFFYWNDSDLGNHVLTFVPDGSANFYLLCREETVEFPTGPTGGTVLSLGDDNSIQVNLTGGKQVSIFGQSYSSFWVGSNGYITFGSGDSNPNETFANHFSKKRISGLFDDLDPSTTTGGGTVRSRQYLDRVVVTFEDVPEKGTTNSNSFQIEMFFEGTIALTHLNIDAKDGLCGLSEGNGIPSNFIDSDLSSFFVCADFNRDYRINLGDLGVLSEFWSSNNCSNLIWCEGTDLDRSDQVDSYDMDQFSPYWLERISIAPPVEAEDGLPSIASQDGRVWDDGAGRTGSVSDDIAAKALRLGDNVVGSFDHSYRSIVSFDTSYLPDDARVISATLELTRSTGVGLDNPFDWGGSCLIDIASPHFGDSNELNDEDWGASADAVAIASFLEDTSEDSPMVSTEFNLDGRMNINKYATTQLRVYFSTLTNGDGGSDYIGYYSGEWQYDESYWPKLTVRYITRRPVLKFFSIADEDGRVHDEGDGIGAGLNYTENNNGALRLGDYEYDWGFRTILSFDTTTIFEHHEIESVIEYYEIESVVLQMTRGRSMGQNPFEWGGACFVDVASPYLGNGPQVEFVDWQATSDANSVAYFTADPGEDQAMVSTEFNAEGISNINLDGKTQLRVYFTTPVLDNGITDYLGFYPGEQTTFESYRPTLIIRYAPN